MLMLMGIVNKNRKDKINKLNNIIVINNQNKN